jgi:hypothetical protein
MDIKKFIEDNNIVGTFEIVENSDSWFEKAMTKLQEQEDEEEQ